VSAQPKGIAVGPDEGDRIRSPIGGDITFLVRGEQSNGALAALEAVAPPGEGPPLHFHGREDETVYIIEGDFRWKLGDELRKRGPGPAGMEGFFDALSSMTEFDLDTFRAAAADHAMEIVGPALAESDPL